MAAWCGSSCFDWLHKSFGEGFALLEEKLRGIQLHGSEGGDAFLTYLARQQIGVRYLQELDLSDSPVTDASVGILVDLPLRRLNVARTALTWGGVWDVLTALPACTGSTCPAWGSASGSVAVCAGRFRALSLSRSGRVAVCDTFTH